MKVWRFTVIDEDKIPRKYLSPDLTKIGQLVRAMKSATDIPGVQAFEDSIVAVGR